MKQDSTPIIRRSESSTLAEAAVKDQSESADWQALYREAQRAREDAEAHAQRLASALAGLGEGLVALDADLRYRYVNPFTLQLMERTEEEVLGQSFYDLYPDLKDTPYEKGMQTALREQRQVEVDVFYPKNGKYWRARISPAGTGLTVYFRDVTELKATEIIQRRLAAIINSSDDAIIGKTLDGIITNWNPAAARMFGYSAEEAIGKPKTMLFPPDRLDEERVILERLRQGIPTDHFESIRMRKDGTLIHVALTISPIRDESGQIVGASTIARDITERKQAEHALRESEILYRTLGEAVPDFVWACGTQGEALYMNRRMAEYTGLTLEQSHKLPAEVLHHPDDLPHLAETWQTTVPRGEPYEVEFRFRRYDGVYRWFMARVVPVKDEAGNVVQWVGTTTDIHERKMATQALRASEEQFRATFEQAAVGIAHVRLDGQWLLVNQKLCDIVGYSREELLERTFQDITHPDDLDTDLAYIRQMIAGEIQTYAMEKRYIRKDGSLVWINLTVTLIREPTGEPKYFLSVVEDITQRKQLEMRLHEEAKTLEIIHAVGQRLSAELDLEKMVQAATDASTQLIGAQFGAFFYNVVNSKSEAYTLFTISGVPREAFSRFPMPRNTAIFAPTFAGERTVRLEDVTQDPRYGQNAPYMGMPSGHLPVVSYLAVPVVSRSGEVMGGLFWGHEKPGVFTERHERIVEGLAAQAAIAIDNARLFQAERERSQQLVTAVREVHHRVKNSLQGVSALLEMQIMSDATTLPVEVIKDSLSQIKTIALVHDLLAHDQPIDKVDVAQVLTNLVSMLSITMGAPEHPLPILLNAESLWIPIRPAIALALTVNELITNAAKHSNTPSTKDATRHDATIRVSLQQEQQEVHVSVQDNGPGFPAGFDPLRDANLGLEVVHTLVSNDLKGYISFYNQNSRRDTATGPDERGARVEITFSPAKLSD